MVRGNLGRRAHQPNRAWRGAEGGTGSMMGGSSGTGVVPKGRASYHVTVIFTSEVNLPSDSDTAAGYPLAE